LLGCLSLLGPAIGLADEEAPQIDDPAVRVEQALKAAETPEEQLAVLKTFLKDYPNHEQMGQAVDHAAYLLSKKLDDTDGAVELVHQQLQRTDNPELVAEIQHVLMGLYNRPAYGKELEALVAEMYTLESMSYVDHLTVIKTAAAAEAWTLVDEHCVAARPAATVEAFAAAYPDHGFSEQYIEAAGKNRQGLLDTYTGWSAANRGDTKAALKDFERAHEHLRPSYLGVPDNELYRYWGETLLTKGDVDKGLEKLALAGIFGGDDVAYAKAEETFADHPGKVASFEDYLWKLRTKHGRKVEDFKAVDYEDQQQSFDELRGKKATLLAFWFPT